jgi:hypothetical protein
MSWHLKADPRIDNLRADLRFAKLWHRLGMPGQPVLPIGENQLAEKGPS